ncbi:AzlD domain-containing protein [Silvanigrella aquatica]|uniref:Branched-chain amino acid ABC transporter n=1 Tax=Silvanigrella aquatica TaxID=1915309 RepID=A0A1L4D292_9BACT|nr:AzlD domain-containing protein [Silvanigrella aquatica]APJ04311.1 hypothetical protein AXG55_10495 [Silvanigrella aquatica]
MLLTELLFLIFVITVITFIFRYLPFVLPKNIIQNEFVINFGKKLPSGIMLILFLYSSGLSEEHVNPSFVYASFIAAIPVVITYIWKKNAVLSIFIGVAFFYIFSN